MSEPDPWAGDDEASDDGEYNFVGWIMDSLKQAAASGKLFELIPWVAASWFGFNAGYRHSKNLLLGLGGALAGIVSLKLALAENNTPAQIAGVAGLAGIGLATIVPFQTSLPPDVPGSFPQGSGPVITPPTAGTCPQGYWLNPLTGMCQPNWLVP